MALSVGRRVRVQLQGLDMVHLPAAGRELGLWVTRKEFMGTAPLKAHPSPSLALEEAAVLLLPWSVCLVSSDASVSWQPAVGSSAKLGSL